MFAEEYLVKRVQELENKIRSLESSNDRKKTENEELRSSLETCIRILNIILKNAELTVHDIDRACDLGVARLKLPESTCIFHGDRVCEILQNVYESISKTRPWEPPTTDPEFNDIVHRRFKKIEDPGLEEHLRTKALREKGAEEKKK